MNKENFDMLKGTLQNLGFTDDPELLAQLEDELSQDQFSFQLSTRSSFDDLTSIEARLHFYRPNRNIHLRLVKYSCVLTYFSDPSKSRFNTFFMHDGGEISFREAFNLLQGRSIYKPHGTSIDKPHDVWLQLDFDRRDTLDNYLFREFRVGNSYPLEKVLRLYPIAELSDEDSEDRLIASLHRGDLLIVNFELGNPKKMYISANPRYRNINVYPAPGTSTKSKFNHKYKSNRPRF